MKKLILIIAFLLVAVSANAANYYGCATASLNSDNTFCATPSGSCAGSDAVSAATALQAGNTLYANGCTISITDSFTATGISTADGDGAGSAVAGGGFTLDLATVTGKTITSNIQAGTTNTLSISGNGSGNSLTILGNITGSTTTATNAIFDTISNGTITIGASDNLFSITGGSVASAVGYRKGTNNGGTLVIYGNLAGGEANSAHGYLGDRTQTVTINGNCTAWWSGSNSNRSYGYWGVEQTPATITGSVIWSGGTPGALNYYWAPSTAKKYTKIGTSSGNYLYLGSGLSSDADGTQITGANTAAKILNDTYFIRKDTYDGSTLTQGTASASGGSGGAWGF